jgi:FkbM family methyltransferase
MAETYSTNLSGFTVYYSNRKEFHTLKREIWGKNIYYVDNVLLTHNPLIIDLGSHIGLSILYFAYNYTNSLICGYEPNPLLFELLTKNIKFNDLESRVQIFQKAVGTSTGKQQFFIDSTDEEWYSSGAFTPGSWKGVQESKAIEVDVESFRIIIENALDDRGRERVDLLKMDIEGSEYSVIKKFSDMFRKVNNLIVELHGVTRRKFQNTVKILNGAGLDLVEEIDIEDRLKLVKFTKNI